MSRNVKRSGGYIENARVALSLTHLKMPACAAVAMGDDESVLAVFFGTRHIGWQQALEQVAHLFDAHGVEWWTTGSAALAARGAPLTPGDVDLVIDADAQRAVSGRRGLRDRVAVIDAMT